MTRLDTSVIEGGAPHASSPGLAEGYSRLSLLSLTAPSTTMRWLLVATAFVGGFLFWASLGPYGDFASVCVFAGTFLVLLGLGQQIIDLLRLEHPQLDASESLDRGWRAAIFGRILLAVVLILFCAVRAVWYWIEPTVLAITGNEPWVGWWDNPGQQVCDAAFYTLLLIGVAPERNTALRMPSFTGLLSIVTAVVAVPAVLIMVNQQAVFTALVSLSCRGLDASSTILHPELTRYPGDYGAQIQQLFQVSAIGLFACCLDPRQIASFFPKPANPRLTIIACTVLGLSVSLLCLTSVNWFRQIEPDIFRGVFESLAQTSWAVLAVAIIPAIAIATVVALRPQSHSTETVPWGQHVHYVNEGCLAVGLLSLPLFFSMQELVLSAFDIAYHGLTTGTYWSPAFGTTTEEWTDSLLSWVYNEVLYHPLLLGVLWALILRLVAIGSTPPAKQLHGQSTPIAYALFGLSLVRLAGLALFSLLAAHCAVVAFTSS
ncbi:MAG TPA: hypothetical protein DDW52_19155 [Planctomycetaceae bacterium]|nr:hypothetical protein [Planctomycetaceae bacterium]